MNVILVGSEVFPFAKTGGLADVIGALPRALEQQGHGAAVFLPAYKATKQQRPYPVPTGLNVRVALGPRMVEGSILASHLPGSTVPVYLIDQPEFFDRDGIYGQGGADYSDNCARFIFFARAVLEAIRLLDLRPDVLHCNDWQTGLIPVYLEEQYRARARRLATVGTVMTIHNLAFQGSFWHWDMPLTGLDWPLFHWQKLECYGRLNFLKAGLVYADLINTVSPTYAAEIQTPEYGRGLDGLLRTRSKDLSGIVNGIDPAVWDPAIDPHLAGRNYDRQNLVAGKAASKAYLQRRCDLPVRADVPVFAQIGRLDSQKGWDLLVDVADGLLSGDAQMVVLGEGNPYFHDRLGHLAAKHPGKLRTFLEFSTPLAHQIEAGADLFLMPSLYEPCGLNQLYSLAYGTVPIVRATGGLADTVVDATPEALASGQATGFSFRDPTPGALWGAIERALALWADKPAWRRLMANGMAADWSWDRSARSYVALYEAARSRHASARAAG